MPRWHAEGVDGLHVRRAGLARDARRHHAMAVAGWWVLRFSWKDVMVNPALVHETLVAAVDGRTERGCPRCPAA